MKKVKWSILVAILVLLGVILYVCFAKKDTPEAEESTVVESEEPSVAEQPVEVVVDETLVKEAFDIGIHYSYSMGIDYIMKCHEYDILEEEIIDNELLGEVESYLYPLNLEKMSEKEIEHLPVYKMDTLEELEQFIQTLQKMDNYLGFEVSLDEITEGYDEEFFEENTLILAYLYASSGSYYYSVESVRMQDNTLSVHVKCTNPLEGETCDVANYFVTVSVPDSVIADCTEFDVDVKY